MHIVCTLDDHYLIPTAVLLTSLCENNKEEQLTIHIVANRLKEETQMELKTIVQEQYKQDIYFYFSDFNKIINRFRLGNPEGHLSLAAFFRLFVSSILPKSIHKVIYLDGDIIIRKNISSLWNIDIEGYALAAVEDEGSVSHIKRGLFSKLGLSPYSLYFNSGVLLINLEYWRQFNVEDRCLIFFEKHNFQLHHNDQDILNGVLYDEKKMISLSYNLSDNFYRKKRESRPDIWAEADSLLLNPHILHFTRANKPWLKSCAHPMQYEYFKSLLSDKKH